MSTKFEIRGSVVLLDCFNACLCINLVAAAVGGARIHYSHFRWRSSIAFAQRIQNIRSDCDSSPQTMR